MSRATLSMLLAGFLLSTLAAGAPVRRPYRPQDSGALFARPAEPTNTAPADSLPALRRGADLLIRYQRLPEALSIYRRIVQTAPNDLGACITLADLYAWTGDYDHAIALYRDVVDRDTVNLAGLKGLARVYRWATRYDQSESAYERVLGIEKGDVEALAGMAQTFAQQRYYERALAYIEKANTLSPRNPDILLIKGDILAWGNQFKAAEETYNKILEIDPASAATYKGLGDLYGWSGLPGPALAMLRKAHRLDPKNPDILIRMGNVAIDAGKVPEAEEAVKELFTLDPSNSHGFDILRRIELRQTIDYAALVDNYAKPIFLILSNIIIGLYFHGRRDSLRLRGGPYWRIAYYVWPALALLWLAIFLAASVSGVARVIGFTEIAEFATLAAWMLAFVTLVWTSRINNGDRKKSVLAIGAHPDDIELGCGGTLSRYKETGYRVYGLVMTAGEEGNPHASGNGDRRSEARIGAGILGLDDVWVYDFRDTALAGQINEMKKVIEEKIRQTGAGIIVTQSPFDLHQDHKAVFEATKIAARGDKSLLCYEDVSTESHFAANYFVDITGYIGDKIRAVQAHRTQREKLYMNPRQITGRASHRGLQTGVKYAEAFLLYKGVDL